MDGSPRHSGVDGYGVEDVRNIAMAPWARTGGNAAFVNLYGMEGVTGMYVRRNSAGGTLTPKTFLRGSYLRPGRPRRR